ncbi:MAG: hypothetical protein WC731_06575 [Candidatus Omnitrophota bacterium]
MKRVALLLLPFAVACASLPGGGSGTGAVSPSAAIQQFLAAAQRKDLTAMANVWGTEKGPASQNMSQRELERRELIMIQCLPHEQATLGTPAPSEAGRLRIPVEITLLTRKAKPIFTVVRGPKDRWYVENLEIDQLRDQGFCGAASAPAAPPPGPR